MSALNVAITTDGLTGEVVVTFTLSGVSRGTDGAEYGSPVVFNVKMKSPSGSWASATGFGHGNYLDSGTPAGCAQVLRLPANMVSFDLRVTSVDVFKQSSPGLTSSESWNPGPPFDVSYTAPAVSVPAVAALDARTLTYKQVRDGLIARKYSSTPNAAEMARIAEFITAANRLALQGYKWSELVVTEAVTCDNGKVLWSAIRGASERTFYTADPRPANSRALKIQEKSFTDDDGVWLESGSLTSVWVQYVPRLPRFSSVEVESGTSYGLGSVRYHDSSGHCYECIATGGALGSEIADATKWRALPLLWETEEVVKSFAEAACYSRAEERGQASSIRKEAHENLENLKFNDCRNRNHPR